MARLSWVQGNPALMTVTLMQVQADGTKTAIDLSTYDSWECKVWRLSSYKKVEGSVTAALNASGQVVLSIPATIERGVYSVEIICTKNGYGRRSYEVPVFSIVDSNGEAHVTYDAVPCQASADIDMDFQLLPIAEVIGKNAYEMWKELPGHEDKTLQDYLDEVVDLDGITEACVTATEEAEAAAVIGSHPDYIGEDNYVYHWTDGAYAKTDIYCKGDKGDPGSGGGGVQSDWNQTDTTADDYIKNKPTIPDVSGKADKATTLAGYGITDAKIASGTITLGSDSITPLTSHQDISGKADKVSSATSGNFAALDSNGNLTDSGHKHSDYLTSHQDISNYVQKSETAGLIKNDGTIDTNTYLTSAHEVPSGGNAGQILSKNSATDYDLKWVNQTQNYPSAYCTTAAGTAAKVASCSLWVATANSYLHVLIGQANTSSSALTLNVNSTGAKPVYINGAASSSSNYTLPAGTYIVFYDGTNYYFRTDGKMPGIGGYLESTPTIATSLPVGDLALNTYYALSTALTGAVTVTLPSVSDTAHVASIALSFETGSGFTSLTITPPTGVTVSYYDGYAIEASKEYELNLLWSGSKWIVSYAVIE